MSREQMEVLKDDIDGTLIWEGEGRTVEVSIDGRNYELDLTNEHISELEEVLARFIGAAESSAPAPAQPTRPAPRSNNNTSRQSNNNRPEDLAVVRDWARRNGFQVSARGRIPFSVMDAFAKAHLGNMSRR